jgi:hypothetical protein
MSRSLLSFGEPGQRAMCKVRGKGDAGVAVVWFNHEEQSREARHTSPAVQVTKPGVCL